MAGADHRQQEAEVFPVTAIHQIEITSRCNLRCRYCVHPSMSRAKQDMDESTYRQTLALTQALIRKYPGRQTELNLAGIGESTMHPEFVRFLYLAREAVGPRMSLVIATNGLLMTPALAREIKDARPDVYVSMHRPEKAGPAIEALRAEGLLRGVSADPSIAAVDWAGQIKWHVSTPAKGTQCKWVRTGWAIALSDGRLARCSFDGTASETIGTVWDEPDSLRTAPYALCDSCHLDVGVPRHQPQVEAQVTNALNQIVSEVA